MTRDERIDIAQETLRIIRQEGYDYYGRRILLHPAGTPALDAVEVFSPALLEDIAAQYAALTPPGGQKCSFHLADRDSLAAAQGEKDPLVMNFASARRPGGGFLSGASAQEESLCRASTLYASIASPEAAEMYRHNNSHPGALYSDYMLLSPNVVVFRDSRGGLSPRPYRVAVGTVAAPNLSGPARGVAWEALDNARRGRLRKFLQMAAVRGYKTLVLGAWGCGVFANDPAEVAEDFRALLVDEGLQAHFEKVVFAILGRGENFSAFQRVLAEELKQR